MWVSLHIRSLLSVDPCSRFAVSSDRRCRAPLPRPPARVTAAPPAAPRFCLETAAELGLVVEVMQHKPTVPSCGFFFLTPIVGTSVVPAGKVRDAVWQRSAPARARAASAG